MATTYHKLSGKAVWAKVHRPDTKFTPAWSIGIVLDDENKKAFKALKKEYGLRMNLKDTDNTPGFDDGMEYIVLRRKVDKPWGKHESPVVEDPKGNHIAEDIGNGSDVTVEFNVYGYNYQGAPGNAAEFSKVTVHNLVVYEKPQATTASEPEVADDMPPVQNSNASSTRKARPF